MLSGGNRRVLSQAVTKDDSLLATLQRRRSRAGEKLLGWRTGHFVILVLEVSLPVAEGRRPWTGMDGELC